MNYLDVARMMKQAGLFGDTMLGRGINDVFGDTFVGRTFGASPEQQMEGFYRSQETPEQRAERQRMAAEYDAQQAAMQQRISDNMAAQAAGQPYESLMQPGQTVIPGDTRYHRMIRQYAPDKIREFMYQNDGQNMTEEQAKAIAMGEYQPFDSKSLSAWDQDQIDAINAYAQKNNIPVNQITQARFGIDGKITGLKYRKQQDAQAQQSAAQAAPVPAQTPPPQQPTEQSNNVARREQINNALKTAPPLQKGYMRYVDQNGNVVDTPSQAAINAQKAAQPKAKYVDFKKQNYTQEQQQELQQLASQNGITGNLSRVRLDANGNVTGINGIGLQNPYTMKNTAQVQQPQPIQQPQTIQKPQQPAQNPIVNTATATPQANAARIKANQTTVKPNTTNPVAPANGPYAPMDRTNADMANAYTAQIRSNQANAAPKPKAPTITPKAQNAGGFFYH